MRITEIKQQVKRTDRYSIYGDGRYIFSLSEAELLNLGLKINQEINEDDLRKLNEKAVLDKAYDRSLNLIMRRPRSEWEIRDYLQRKNYDQKIIASVLSKLGEAGYIDDEGFARRWIENRRLLKPTSKRKLRLELKQKHVPDEIIHQCLGDNETDEVEVVRGIIEKKRMQSRYQDEQKLIAYLARQGFSYADIKTALDAD